MSGCRRQHLGRLEVKLRSKSFHQLMIGGQRRQLGRLKVKLKGQDQRLARIEDTNKEILLKLSDLCNVVETLSTPTPHAATQQQQTTNSGESDDRQHQQHEPDLQTPEDLFDQLRNNAKLQRPNLMFGSSNLQQQANSQLGQHDQNNNDCASNVISGASSVGSSRSMSPIDSSNGHHNHHQRQHESGLNMSEHLFEHLRNSGKLQQSALMFGQTNLQQQAAQLGPHDQNNNDCARNVISAATSIGSSPSMSPIEPNNGQAHHQQLQNGHSHQLNTNSSHANSHHLSLHQTILHNLQQQQQQNQDQQIERLHLHQHNNQQNLGVNTNSSNNLSNGGNNLTGASSRHSSTSVSPSPGPASHHSTSAVSPALMGLGNGGQSTGSHESGAPGLGALNASQAQQLIQAAVVAQQQQQHNGNSNSKHHHHHNHHNHNHHQQQQDSNVAALAASAQLLSALGQFGDPELMQVQSRIIASTLAAANAAGNVQQANDLANQLHRAVAAKTPQNGGSDGSNSTSSASMILSQAVHQSNAISQHTTSSTNNGNNNDSNNHHHHHHHHHNQQQHPPPPQHRNSHAEMSSSSSPLLSRHHQASHTTLAHQLAAAAAAAAAANSPINLGNPAAAALAAQMAAVARVNGAGQTTPGQTQQGSSGAGQGDGLHLANGGAGGVSSQIIHSIPHPHSHHALSHPTASLLLNNPHYQTVRTKYSTRRYSRRRVGPEEAMADPAIRATAQLKMPVVPKTILIVLKHRLTVQTAITLACSQTGERLRKGAIQKKLEAMFREPGAVDAFLAEWDHPR